MALKVGSLFSGIGGIDIAFQQAGYPKNYEIFYVVLGEAGKSSHKVWRLGHLFDFVDGEELMHNSRFTVESKEYSITAKPIQK